MLVYAGLQVSASSGMQQNTLDWNSTLLYFPQILIKPLLYLLSLDHLNVIASTSSRWKNAHIILQIPTEPVEAN